MWLNLTRRSEGVLTSEQDDPETEYEDKTAAVDKGLEDTYVRVLSIPLPSPLIWGTGFARKPLLGIEISQKDKAMGIDSGGPFFETGAKARTRYNKARSRVEKKDDNVTIDRDLAKSRSLGQDDQVTHVTMKGILHSLGPSHAFDTVSREKKSSFEMLANMVGDAATQHLARKQRKQKALVVPHPKAPKGQHAIMDKESNLSHKSFDNVTPETLARVAIRSALTAGGATAGATLGAYLQYAGTAGRAGGKSRRELGLEDDLSLLKRTEENEGEGHLSSMKQKYLEMRLDSAREAKRFPAHPLRLLAAAAPPALAGAAVGYGAGRALTP